MNFIRKSLLFLERHKTLFKWVIAITVLAFLFFQHRQQLKQLKQYQLQWSFALAALATCAVAQMMTYIRWYFLVAAQGFDFTIHDAIRLGFIGYLFNYVAPGAVGGDLVKGSLIAREQKSRRAIAVATVLIDRIVGLIGLILLAALVMEISSPLTQNPKFRYLTWTFRWAALALILGMAAVLTPKVANLAIFNRLRRIPKVGGVISELLNTLRLYQSHWRLVVMSVVMSVISHAVLIVSVYYSARSLGVAVPTFVEHLQLVPPAELVGVLVPLPGGTGALEGAIAYFYAMTATGELSATLSGHGLFAGLVYRFVTIVVAVCGAGWYFSDRRKIDAALQDSAAIEEELAHLNDADATPENATHRDRIEDRSAVRSDPS